MHIGIQRVFALTIALTATIGNAQESADLTQTAIYLRQQGQVTESIARLQRALLLAQDENQRMRAAGELGTAYLQARQLDRAEAPLRQALSIAQGEQRAGFELALGNLAILRKDTASAAHHYLRSEQFAATDVLNRNSAALNRVRLGTTPEKLVRLAAIYAELDQFAVRLPGAGSTSVQVLGSLFLNLGDQAASLGPPALPLAWRSLDRARTMSAAEPGSRLHLEALDALAQLYEGQGRTSEALSLTRQALAQLRANLQNPPGELLIALEWRLARNYAAMGDAARSLSAYERAAVQIERIRQDIPIDYDDGQSSFSATFEPVYLGLVDGLLKQADQAPQTQHNSLLRRARDALELIKQTELQDYLGDRCVVDAVKGGSATVILPGTAVIYPVIFADRIELLVETSQGMTRYTTRVARAAVQSTATALSSELRSPQGIYLPQARQLYDWLIRPIEGLLASASIDTLIVVPDTTTRTLPFGALHDGTRFAIEKYAIATATGLSMTNTNVPAARPMTALIAGASTFGSVIEKYSATRLASVSTGPAVKTAPSSAGQASRSMRSMGLPGATGSRNLEAQSTVPQRAERLEALRAALALPGVAREIQALQTILPGTRLVDAGFTVDAFRQAAKDDRYGVVHVASHGVFGGNAESSYILAFDDLLTLDGLQNVLKGEQFQRAPIEILSLSACETAAGNERAPLGISGAAMKARAKSVLGTLWPVDDEAAVTVMTRFYTGIAQMGETKARSLQQSQVHLIRNPQLAHPFFWAPFSLIGNWL